METDATLAIPKSGHLSVWTSTQDTCGSKRALVSLLNVNESTVTVSNTQTGGGYGGKHWKVIVQPALCCAMMAHSITMTNWC